MPNVVIIGTRQPRTFERVVPLSNPEARPEVQSGRIIVGPIIYTSSGEISGRILVQPKRPTGITDIIGVSREPRMYGEDKGWTKSGDTYTGYFGSNSSGWRGEIVCDSAGIPRTCYISDPPRQLWRHPHRCCFSHVGKGKYAVHFNKCPETVDAAIMTVEQVLREATGRRR